MDGKLEDGIIILFTSVYVQLMRIVNSENDVYFL
jgi:hypothetical protein